MILSFSGRFYSYSASIFSARIQSTLLLVRNQITMKTQYFILFISLIYFLATLFACEHSPILPDDDGMPIDTTDMPIDTTSNPTDTMNNDTTGMMEPCDPDLVYFDRDILPILKSNCAFSGCHDEASAEDGVILDSYEQVIATADVEPFDLIHSELYTVLVDDDEMQRMPPSPTPPLNQNHIQLIAKWILQGAEYLECDPNANGCDTEDVSFSAIVQPLIQTYCEGCHSGAVPSGGIDLTTHAAIKAIAEDGRLFGAIDWESGFIAMPLNSNKLDDCSIDQIKNWIDAGALNN